MVYLITYDLKAPGKDYEALFEAIKQISIDWCHPLSSVWIIKSNESSANNIYSPLKSKLDENDYIFVCELNDNKQGWLNKNDWQIMDNNIFR